MMSTAPSPTPQQALVIQTLDRSLVVEAGAGTGKTWVLVARYLHLLAQHPEWPLESLVAITFTEKAAREMRNRIRAGVEERAQNAPPHSPWQQRRQQLDQLQVSTIHSLCARILRENAIAAGLDPHFQVLEEDEAGLLAEEAIRQTLATLGETADHPALPLFASLRVQQIRKTMADLLAQRGTVQQLFDRLDNRETLLARWRREVEQARERRWQQALQACPELAAALEELPQMDALPAGDKLTPHVQAAQRGCHHLGRGEWAAAWEACNTINLRGGAARNWGKERLAWVKAMLRALRDHLKELQKARLLEGIGPLDEQAADSLLAWRALWDELTRTYDGLKEERHALDFDDLERHTVRLLHQQPRSERLQAFLDGIHHVMVDEFQDTNPIQQQILAVLAPPDAPGRLFVVGDAKQSIYRFRQAQVQIFHQMGQQVEQATGQAPIPLNRSFRTHQELVHACNHLFDRLFQPLDGLAHRPYEARPGPLTAARPTPPDAPPPVELWILPAEDGDGERIDANTGRRWEAHLLAERLLSLQADGVPIWDKRRGCYRPFQFQDAAILFRATTSLPLYEEVFQQRGLPYLTVSGRGYYDRPEVRNLLVLLAALHNPGDDFSLAAALRSPLFGLSDETLYRLRWRDGENRRPAEPRPLRAALADPPPTDQDEEIAHAHTVLKHLWSIAGRVDVWQLLRTALDHTGYEVALALQDSHSQGSDRPLSNVQKLLAMAREKGGASLSDFLRRVSDLRAAEAREGEALGREPEGGAVRLMSIHASKGLEFPVVAVADLGRRSTRQGGYILHDPQIGLVCRVLDENGDWQEPASYCWGKAEIQQMEEAESRRLLYVACTRAADRLILSGQMTAQASTNWLAQVLDAWEIEATGPEVAEWSCQADDGSAPAFRIRIHRPATPPPARRPARPMASLSPTLTAMPALCRPVPVVPGAVTRSVTTLLQDMERAAVEEDGPLPLWPAVPPPQPGHTARPVSRYLLGNLVHQALARWTILELDGEALRSSLARIARQLGVIGPDQVEDAVRRARRLLAGLQRSPLFSQIQRARRRLHEVPFTLTTGQGVLHGTLDLLFEDEEGWWLVDWKSEWVEAGAIRQKAASFRPQLAIYHHAARRILGIAPRTGVCLLAASAAVHWYPAEELAEEAASLGLS